MVVTEVQLTCVEKVWNDTLFEKTSESFTNLAKEIEVEVSKTLNRKHLEIFKISISETLRCSQAPHYPINYMQQYHKSGIPNYLTI